MGEAVREHRDALLLTQHELAERASVSERCIRKIETGKVLQPRQSTLRQLADALGLSGQERSRFCALARRQPLWRPGFDVMSAENSAISRESG